MAEFVEEFFGKYGSPEKIAAVLEGTQKFFAECGTPEQIKESLQAIEQMNQFVEEFKSLGVESIEEMKSMLEDMQRTKFENYALNIANNTGLNVEKVVEYLNNGMDERGIVEMLNQASTGFADRYHVVREDLNSVPLKTVDPDGNNVQLRNVTYKNDIEESMSPLSRVLSKSTMAYKPAPANAEF